MHIDTASPKIWKEPEGLDKEVLKLCQGLNAMPGKAD